MACVCSLISKNHIFGLLFILFDIFASLNLFFVIFAKPLYKFIGNK
nr:MAG TPA_asm: hypothetical protein [Caudoviricetes sp.]